MQVSISDIQIILDLTLSALLHTKNNNRFQRSIYNYIWGSHIDSWISVAPKDTFCKMNYIKVVGMSLFYKNTT